MGADYLQAMRDAGRDLHPDDLPPALGWEQPVWWLFQRVRTQWRMGLNGATGLDYNPALALIQARGWDAALALELLQAIELTVLGHERDRD